ncbi:hypothetical protein HQN87_27660 [Paenibacillus tritici]|uniref:PAS fold-4 domain-containing protein n=1 Tax=Paenibacillus tritici TaxID=1873425 RepID=A0ABX2DWK8_9BACL|nr:hypothetical protein [Paenibacillus tritici]NQX49107.1 hypothetical protein [Paenibacillus tritici]
MPDSLSTLFPSLNALTHNALVIDSSGMIRFVSARWDEFNRQYGLTSTPDCLERSILELFQEVMIVPADIHKLEQLLQDMVQGTRLSSSTELALLTLNRGSRLFELNMCPLIAEPAPAYKAAILAIRDIGLPPVIRQLVPICASCKSIRSTQEEWIRIERFLQQQLSLQFTHDICPACIRELYPQYAASLKW